ncbi:MAG TPA: chromate transporter [Stellaceae bacterium]|jgi:chromate transporter|nr:chromate transporter [Stellaceae bacterium]
MDTVGLAEIFFVVFLSSLFSIGGVGGLTAVIQERWVSPGLLDPGLFSWLVALSYMSPGPKCGFLVAIGYYMDGVPGLCAAIAGLILPTCIGSAGVSHALAKMRPAMKFITLPASFAIAGAMVAAAWGLARLFKPNPYEIGAIAVVTILVAWRNVSPVRVVLCAAAIGLVLWLVQH